MDDLKILEPNAADIALVRKHFHALCASFGANQGNVEVQAEWVAVQRAYGEPGRKYHNLRHIAHMLRAFEKLGVAENFMNEWRAFAIYHDFHYQTENRALYRQNEFRSASRGIDFLGALKAPDDFIDVFKSRVLATLTHEIDPGHDLRGALAIDIDMSILGTKLKIYSAYAQAIRMEFINVPDAVFYPARLDFLRKTLAKPRIFKTDLMHAKLDAAARRNMQREYKMINRPLPRLQASL